MNENIIEAKNITKRFINTIALDKVDFILKRGEIHGLIGENGAGKSTLINILTGVIRPDKGEIFLEGKKVSINDPRKATELGFAAVHQNVSLSPNLTIAENIFFGSMPSKKYLKIVDWSKIYSKSKEILKRIGFEDINVKAKVSDLTISQQQVIQIARALSLGSNIKVLILDEPTAILTLIEVKKLFDILKNMRKFGIAIIYISHYLDEILQIADRVTVLKNGNSFPPIENKSISKDKLINMMIGKKLDNLYSYKKIFLNKEEVLKVKKLSGKHFSNIDFTVHKEEIVGIVGLIGSGRLELTRTLFGIYPKNDGEIFLNNKLVEINNPRRAINLGIGLLPADRRKQGLFMEMMIRENITMASLDKVSSNIGVLNKKEENIFSNEISEKLKIKALSTNEIIMNLSGGNQQKVSFAKWIFCNSNILILEEPTTGVDIGTKKEIYKLLQEFINQGKSIILVSSEIPEILGNSDYILVMNKGRIMGEFSRENATKNKILQCMI